MNREQIKDICESICILALNGGELSGFVFRHSDTPQKALTDMVAIQGGAPIQVLSGPRPWKVEMTIEMRSSTAGRLAAIHGACLMRLSDSSIMRGACLAAGLRVTDNFVAIYEEMGGDDSATKSLRKKTITIPVKITVD